MPYRTRYGSHYHMIQGCHGAGIPCDTKGLAPCSDCCGTGEERDASAGTSAAAAIPSRNAVPVDRRGEGRDDPSNSGSRLKTLADRLRALLSADEEPQSSKQTAPAPPSPSALSQALADFEDGINASMRHRAIVSGTSKPLTRGGSYLRHVAVSAKANDRSTVEDARMLAESGTVAIDWPSWQELLPARPMGASLEKVDIQTGDYFPTRAATVTGYSLVEAPPELRRRGIHGIACQMDLRCDRGRLGLSGGYEGIDNFLYGYRDVEPTTTLVPLSRDAWERASAMCEAYEKEGGSEFSPRPSEMVGDVIARDEEYGEERIIEGEVSETPGCDAIRELFDAAAEEAGARVASYGGFELRPRDWDQMRRRMMRGR